MEYSAANPFEEDDGNVSAPPPVPPKGNDSNSPPVPPKSTTQPTFTTPAFSQTSQPTFSYEDLSPQALDRKEMALKMREEDIQRREGQLLDKEQSMPKPRPNNWPRCKPILYHDIREDIPTPEGQSLMRKAYIAWIVIAVTFLWNIITTLSVLIVSGGGSAIASFLLGIAYAIFSIPVSFLIYRTLYNAARKSKPSLYVLFFFLLWIQIAIFILYAIGINGWGAAGFFTMISVFQDDQTIVGIFCVVVTILFALLAIFHIYLFFASRVEYRKVGGSEKAKQEIAAEGARQMAQHPELVKDGITFAAKSQV